MKNYLLLLVSVFCILKSRGQNTIGIPDIINYTKANYKAGSQNRCIIQDKNGIMYFANYEGLLTFDGSYWNIYPLPSKTIIRSLAIGSDNKIYVGGQADFGFFAPSKNGRLTFTSLKTLLPEKTVTTDIWETVAFGNDIFFRSRDLILCYSNNVMNVYQPLSEWVFMGKANNQLIAQDLKNGLLVFREGSWHPFIQKSVLPENILVTTIFPLCKDTSFITTVNSGFFILTSGFKYNSMF